MSKSNESFATLYRPTSFSDVVGQKNIIRLQRELIKSGNNPTQMLFSGPSGTGKTTLARINAAAQMCETPLTERNDADPCGTCEACLDILSVDRTHPDVTEIDGASNGNVEQIRNLAQHAQLVPQRSDTRIFIIDEAHQITGPGGSALLKMLEEPPAHVRFFLATTDPDKMLVANRGRVLEWVLTIPTEHEMVENLQRVAGMRGWNISDDLAAAIVEATDPQYGVRGTLNTLQKVSTVIDSGAEPQEVFNLLGVASPVLVNKLKEGYRAGDKNSILQYIRSAEESNTLQSVYRMLLRSLEADKIDAAQAGSDELLQEIITDEETIITDHVNKIPLDVSLLKLALLRHKGQAHHNPAPKPVEEPALKAPETPEVTAVDKLLGAAPDTLKTLLTTLASPRNGDPGVVEIHATQEILNQLQYNPNLGVSAQKAGVTLKPVPTD